MNEIIALDWLVGAMITCCKLLAACGIIWLSVSFFLHLFETPVARRDRKVREAFAEYEAEMRRQKERLEAFRSEYVSPFANCKSDSPFANSPPSIFGKKRIP